MIKLEKNNLAIPESLIPAFNDLFPTRKNIPVISRHTHEKRMNIINNRAYINTDEYNDRYKKEDVRSALIEIYKSKCAYCEQKIEQYHVEHFRPKSKYYWFAFSWDNLIMACPICNENKRTDFDLFGTFKNFDNTEENIRNINNLSSSYDIVEIPKMVNPEITNPLGKIEFQKDGLIKSEDSCFKYTIEKCKIDRTFLNDERRTLLNIFKRDIRSALVDNEDLIEQQREISIIIRKFIRDSQDLEMQFIAFRRFAIDKNWLNELIKEMN